MGCGLSKPSNADGGGGAGNQSGSGQADGSHELQNYEPVLYWNDETTDAVRDQDRIVTHVHFVAQTVLITGGNHWGIYLQTGPRESISFNMDPSEILGAQAPNHGYRGRLSIRRRDYAVTHNQHKIVTIPANPGHPAAHFIDAIIEEGNHLYDFTTAGRGCTGWIHDQFMLFEQRGLIRSEDNLEGVIRQEWVKGRATKHDIGVTRGSYMKNTTYGGWAGRGAFRGRR